MKAPSLQMIQRLYPLGTVELDSKCRSAMMAVIRFRDTMMVPMTRFMEQETTPKLNDLIESDNEQKNLSSITQQAHDMRVFRMLCAMMAEADDQHPGRDVMIVDNTVSAEAQAGKMTMERVGGGMGIMMAGATPSVPMAMLQCCVHSMMHWLFRFYVGEMLYRMHDYLRFPVHRLIEYNVDVPDRQDGESSGIPHAVITGYNTKLIMALAADDEIIVPDTPEGLFGDDDE